MSGFFQTFEPLVTEECGMRRDFLISSYFLSFHQKKTHHCLFCYYFATPGQVRSITIQLKYLFFILLNNQSWDSTWVQILFCLALRRQRSFCASIIHSKNSQTFSLWLCRGDRLHWELSTTCRNGNAGFFSAVVLPNTFLNG